MDKTLAFRGGDYPRRGNHFAIRFLKLLHRQHVANELGAEACWLLTTVVMVEDEKWYAGAPTFYNNQLQRAAGFSSEDKLDRIRQLCVDMGWLHYEPGGKGVAGIYWAIWPDRYLAEAREIEVSENLSPQFAGTSAETTAGEVRRQPREKCGTSYPTLKPDPPPPPPDLAAVAEKLISIGLALATETADQAARQGVTPAQMDAVIAYYESRPGAWKPGAVRTRLILKDAYRLPPEQGWPAPGEDEQKLKARERGQAAQTALRSDAAKARETRAGLTQKFRQLELQFGERLNLLSREEQAELIADRPFLVELLLRKGPDFHSVRAELLKAFSARYSAN